MIWRNFLPKNRKTSVTLVHLWGGQGRGNSVTCISCEENASRARTVVFPWLFPGMVTVTPTCKHCSRALNKRFHKRTFKFNEERKLLFAILVGFFMSRTGMSKTHGSNENEMSGTWQIQSTYQYMKNRNVIYFIKFQWFWRSLMYYFANRICLLHMTLSPFCLFSLSRFPIFSKAAR